MFEGTDDTQLTESIGSIGAVGGGGGWLRCNNCDMVRGECVDCGAVLYAGRIFCNRSTHQYMRGPMLKALASHKKEGCSSAPDASTSAAAAAPAPGSQKRSRQATESGDDYDAADGGFVLELEWSSLKASKGYIKLGGCVSELIYCVS